MWRQQISAETREAQKSLCQDRLPCIYAGISLIHHCKPLEKISETVITPLLCTELRKSRRNFRQMTTWKIPLTPSGKKLIHRDNYFIHIWTPGFYTKLYSLKVLIFKAFLDFFTYSQPLRRLIRIFSYLFFLKAIFKQEGSYTQHENYLFQNKFIKKR